MRFTIAIPTYNRRNLIERTLQSLEKQTYKDFEVIIADDGSTDDTESFIKDYSHTSDMKIRYFWKENGGKHTALNLAIEKAEGELFLIVDSDDWMLPHGLETLNQTWEGIPEEDRMSFSGVMARAKEPDGTFIGKPFPADPFISSYVDFHFISGISKGPYKDCVDFIRTDLIRKYRYPELKEAKFVPEAYITDQIGMNHKLFCISDVVEIKEYQEEGITKNIDAFKTKNAHGMIAYYGILLREVFPKSEEIVPLASKIYIWYRYLEFRMLTGQKIDPEEMNLLGWSVKALSPLIGRLHRARKKRMGS
ncbi:glycosyltransferase family 2 protein [Proteiniclasticum sp. SCR006]|uniref:Glycosyltransferase family 2 protein n=1 Tax=Proteiniclasticum aestuarii TaxID=2817862 RepID=A0A939H8R8_9CLOT|nr:glycosyltransferase family 2 protein [Proteiniclasticum aestuarii]MBO1266319.1 glycosyltransferase family 2 protein [Proteiniclasticum aestuarii]